MMISPSIYIAESAGKGRGVFAKETILPETVIEISPVIVMSEEERHLIDKTRLHDYIFIWGKDQQQCCMATGYIPLYNHDSPSNCEHFMDYDEELIFIKTVRKVEAGEELTINYNGDHDDPRPVWFPEL
jgi:uncharacterized protein